MALAAWVVPAPGPVPSVSQLRRELRETLPDWMVPTSVQLVAQLPLNERGKLDVAALPDPPPRPAPRPAAGWWDREIGQIWADVLGLESVDPDEGFIQLGGDSLATEEMLSRLHDNLSLDLTVTQLAENPTLREFAALAERAATGGKGQERTSPTVVRLRDAGSRVPLVCFAGAATHGLAFTSLAGALPDHPVHAFHASGLVSRAKLDWSIRSHARRHVRDLTRLVPEGPVVLLGHSLGGLIAIEAARMLAEQGREVPLLVLLDAFLPPRHGGYVGNWSVRPPYGAAQGAFTPPEPPSVPTPRSPLALLLHTLRTQSRDEVQQRLLLPFAGALQLPTELNKKVFWQQGLWLSRTARLGPWPGRTLVLYTDENPDDMENWDALLTGEHTVLRVEGDHPGILRPPYLDAVVRLIEEQLEQVTVHPAG
jgi:thioesterase domain-containing protein/aryl carrier-like protein